jgi:hypothetical protein
MSPVVVVVVSPSVVVLLLLELAVSSLVELVDVSSVVVLEVAGGSVVMVSLAVSVVLIVAVTMPVEVLSVLVGMPELSLVMPIVPSEVVGGASVVGSVGVLLVGGSTVRVDMVDDAESVATPVCDVWPSSPQPTTRPSEVIHTREVLRAIIFSPRVEVEPNTTIARYTRRFQAREPQVIEHASATRVKTGSGQRDRARCGDDVPMTRRAW